MDLDGFNRRFKDHPHLSPVISRWRGMRPTHLSSLYEYLVIAIFLQNATVRRTVSMCRVLFEAYGRLVCYELYGLIGEDEIKKWARSEDLWQRRAALVSTVALNMRSQGGRGDTTRTLAVCRLLVDDHEDAEPLVG